MVGIEFERLPDGHRPCLPHARWQLDLCCVFSGRRSRSLRSAPRLYDYWPFTVYTLDAVVIGLGRGLIFTLVVIDED